MLVGCFTESEEMLRRQTQEFVAKEIKPRTKELAQPDVIPRWLSLRLGEMGYLGVAVPEKYGGQGLDVVSQGIVVEELTRGSVSAPRLVTQAHTIYFLLTEASDEAKLRQYYPGLTKGEITVAIAITESDCGTDAAAMKTRAVKQGDQYVINGEKTAITWTMHEDLKMIVVWAKTDPEARARGISCFAVPADAPGLSKSKIPLLGYDCGTSGSLTFENVRVPCSSLIGEEGRGFYYLMRRFDTNKIMLALQTLGLAQASLEDTTYHVRERKTFGKPLGKYEAISFKIADDLTQVTAARLLCYHALRRCEQGTDFVKEAAMSKLLAPRLATQVIQDCLLMHGYVGYSEESQFPYLLRHALGYQIADGTAEAQMMILVREVLGREFLPY